MDSDQEEQQQEQQQQEEQQQQWMNVTFKRSFTSDCMVYEINPNWTLCELYHQLEGKIHNHFRIQHDRIKLIDTLRPPPHNGRRSIENDVALTRSSQKINELWNDLQLPFLSFYITDGYEFATPSLHRSGGRL